MEQLQVFPIIKSYSHFTFVKKYTEENVAQFARGICFAECNMVWKEKYMY